MREQGYGEDNEEQEEGLRCIAVPVFDRFGVVIAGLSISFPTLRFSEERLQEYVAMLHTAARKISAQMGYHDYPFWWELEPVGISNRQVLYLAWEK